MRQSRNAVEATADNALERTCSVGGPRLMAADASWPAARLGF